MTAYADLGVFALNSRSRYSITRHANTRVTGETAEWSTVPCCCIHVFSRGNQRPLTANVFLRQIYGQLMSSV